jgi:hypothetical protein
LSTTRLLAWGHVRIAAMHRLERRAQTRGLPWLAEACGVSGLRFEIRGSPLRAETSTSAVTRHRDAQGLTEDADAARIDRKVAETALK